RVKNPPGAAAPTPAVRLLPQLLEFAASRYGDGDFVLRYGAEGWRGFTFVEAARATHAMTALLEHVGVKPGDRVALQSENRPEWGLAWLAVLEAGAVVVPLDAQLKVQEVGEILAASGASHAIVSARQRAVIEEARRARALQLQLIGLDESGDEPSWPEAQRR